MDNLTRTLVFVFSHPSGLRQHFYDVTSSGVLGLPGILWTASDVGGLRYFEIMLEWERL